MTANLDSYIKWLNVKAEAAMVRNRYTRLKEYICVECETTYTTPLDTPPPSPKWRDGHVCTLMDKDEFKRKRKKDNKS